MYEIASHHQTWSSQNELKIYESTLHHNTNQSFKTSHAYTFFQISIFFVDWIVTSKSPSPNPTLTEL